jgi:hypothetical protein
MSRCRESRSIAVLIVLVAIAVLLCASLAVALMGVDHMAGMDHGALFCCLLLVVSLTLFAFIHPSQPLFLSDPSLRTRPRQTPEDVFPAPPPDRVAFGSLLI